MNLIQVKRIHRIKKDSMDNNGNDKFPYGFVYEWDWFYMNFFTNMYNPVCKKSTFVHDSLIFERLRHHVQKFPTFFN